MSIVSPYAASAYCLNNTEYSGEIKTDDVEAIIEEKEPCLPFSQGALFRGSCTVPKHVWIIWLV